MFFKTAFRHSPIENFIETQVQLIKLIHLYLNLERRANGIDEVWTILKLDAVY